MRKIKFRAWDIIDNRMIQWYDRLFKEAKNDSKLCDFPLNNIEKSFLKYMQYTETNDNSPWNEITDNEKKNFYNENCSEDGQTIKYQHIEDIKKIWKGKEIYEGDVLQFVWESDSCWGVAGIYKGHVRFSKGLYEVAYIGREKIRKYKDGGWCENNQTDELRGLMSWSEDVEIIGNIHENPELLEVEANGMSDINKLELINSIKVVDYSSSGKEMEYVLIDDSNENREILYKIGMTDLEIKDECFSDDGCLDLIVVGFKYADTWFKDKGFCNE